MSKKPLPPEFQQPDGESRQRELTRRDFVRIAGAVGAFGAAITAGELLTPSGASAAPAPRPTMTTPTLTCVANGSDPDTVIDVTVCAPAGGTGLPAGFSLQWMTLADYVANGNAWYLSDDPRICKASFSGNANGSTYNLLAGACLTVHVGNFLIDNQQGYSTTCDGALACDTAYVFRAFGHATSTQQRSAFTSNCSTSTGACDEQLLFAGCTKSKGYFRQPLVTNPSTGVVTENNNGSADAIRCALAVLGGTFTVGTYTFSTLQQVADIWRGGPPTVNDNVFTQGIALTLNIAMSGNCTNNCTGQTYPSGLGSATICNVVDGVTALHGTATFPAGSAAKVNGRTVQSLLDEANLVLTGAEDAAALLASTGLSIAQLGDLLEKLNTAFDGQDAAHTCCGASAFGAGHLCA